MNENKLDIQIYNGQNYNKCNSQDYKCTNNNHGDI